MCLKDVTKSISSETNFVTPTRSLLDPLRLAGDHLGYIRTMYLATVSRLLQHRRLPEGVAPPSREHLQRRSPQPYLAVSGARGDGEADPCASEDVELMLRRIAIRLLPRDCRVAQAPCPLTGGLQYPPAGGLGWWVGKKAGVSSSVRTMAGKELEAVTWYPSKYVHSPHARARPAPERCEAPLAFCSPSNRITCNCVRQL